MWIFWYGALVDTLNKNFGLHFCQLNDSLFRMQFISFVYPAHDTLHVKWLKASLTSQATWNGYFIITHTQTHSLDIWLRGCCVYGMIEKRKTNAKETNSWHAFNYNVHGFLLALNLSNRHQLNLLTLIVQMLRIKYQNQANERTN